MNARATATITTPIHVRGELGLANDSNGTENLKPPSQILRSSASQLSGLLKYNENTASSQGFFAWG